MENKEQLPSTINLADPQMIKTLQSTVAKGTTPEEFAIFAEHVKATKLNPFKGEVWCIKTNQRVQIMTGINGYFAIANNHPAYDGMEIETSQGEGGPVESICRVYRKDRSRPAIGKARWAEDSKPYGVWKEKPTLMLEKVAKTRALREAFPQELNGLYTQEEMPAEYAAPAVEVKSAVVPEAEPEKAYHYYDLIGLPPEKEGGAQDYLAKHHDSIQCLGSLKKLIISEQPLPRFKRYEVPKVQFEARLQATGGVGGSGGTAIGADEDFDRQRDLHLAGQDVSEKHERDGTWSAGRFAALRSGE